MTINSERDKVPSKKLTDRRKVTEKRIKIETKFKKSRSFVFRLITNTSTMAKKKLG